MLAEARKLGLINPVTGEGAPTFEMLVDCVHHAECDAEAKATGFDHLIDLADKWDEEAGVLMGDGYQHCCAGHKGTTAKHVGMIDTLKRCAAELRKVNIKVTNAGAKTEN